MNRIKAVIIDDESGARQTLQMLLEKFFPEVEIMGEADSVKSGTELLQNTSADLVFLDIEMPPGNSFDILDNLKKIDFDIIFITAYNQYALEAFKFSAVDYLLKPVKISDLKSALEKFKKRRGNSQEQKIRVLSDHLRQEINRIVLPTTAGFEIVSISEIMRLEGDRNYTNFVFTNGKKILVSKTLKEFEDMLVTYGFFRIHQSYIVNLKHIKKYYKGNGGEIEMVDGQILGVARNRKDDFLKQFV
ncbi:MAG: hypothetical protein A2W91_12670 [Bacteroidetes bacterium GWF2_38_335]|nr:MAG: hypothetical protein A2W91_12670 [Bacteroidetes bacterium GWF2_38_335]OFY77020.1 MAG: hypothetical protein A2281_00785 [Bacteroidetes bacterium RIFOXYA12_FULL_38_20]HBS86878.1 DNA-binding response regulator [Bacteroidales bacterium]